MIHGVLIADPERCPIAVKDYNDLRIQSAATENLLFPWSALMNAKESYLNEDQRVRTCASSLLTSLALLSRLLP